MALSTETKVGIFFLIGLAILGVITFRVANVSEYFQPKAVLHGASSRTPPG